MAIDKNIKQYDSSAFDAIFKKVFNNEVLTDSEKNLLKNVRVYEDDTLNQQYKYVFESADSGVEGFAMTTDDKYYEDSNFNGQFVNRMNNGPVRTVTTPSPNDDASNNIDYNPTEDLL